MFANGGARLLTERPRVAEGKLVASYAASPSWALSQRAQRNSVQSILGRIMSVPSVRLSLVALLVALVLGAAVSPLARSQVQAAPSPVPIGVSSSGNTSTVWFHDPHSRQALACQTVVTPSAGLSSIQCVATKLP